jgi:N-acetylmuramic acid 6-phosphate etherase
MKKTMDLDEMSTRSFLETMNDEDQKVSLAVRDELQSIEQVVEAVARVFNHGGRLIYLGAGTSGRLGILDAVECVPTFGTNPEMVVGLIAGGDKAIKDAVEGAEDSLLMAKEDLMNIQLTQEDIVIGIAASGRTPYVIGGLNYAQHIGALTAAISCNKNSEIANNTNYAIEVCVGPEVITGSTRLKSGTAQKMILNMITTGAMIAIGKSYGNLMVDVKPTNEKLIERSKHIIRQATGVSYEIASDFYKKSNSKPKNAIVMIKTRCTFEESVKRLKLGNDFVKCAIEYEDI